MRKSTEIEFESRRPPPVKAAYSACSSLEHDRVEVSSKCLASSSNVSVDDNSGILDEKKNRKDPISHMSDVVFTHSKVT